MAHYLPLIPVLFFFFFPEKEEEMRATIVCKVSNVIVAPVNLSQNL